MDHRSGLSILLSKLNIFIYILIFTVVFHLVANIAWIVLDSTPVPWDEAGHTMHSIDFVEYAVGESSKSLLKISDYYPPFVYWVVSFFMMIFGTNVTVGPLIITGFFIISIIFLYLYTKELLKNRFTALVATLFFSLQPAIYGLSRYYLLDIPLIALVLIAAFFLEKTQHFRIKKYIILFSIFFGGALLTKWYAFIYLGIPLLLEAVILFKSKETSYSNLTLIKTERLVSQIPWKVILLSASIILAINLPWYLTNFNSLLVNSGINIKPEEGDVSGLNFNNLKYYFQLMTNFQLTWLGMIIFLAGILTFIKNQKLNAVKILGSILFIYLVFTIIGNKNIRYTIYLIPLASIIVAFFITKVFSFSKYLGYLLSVVFIFYYLGYFFSLSFGIPIDPLKDNFRRTVFIPYLGGIDYINLGKDTSSFLAPRYQSEIWPQSQILHLISYQTDNHSSVLVIVEKPHLNPENLKLSQRLENINNLDIDAPYSMDPFTNPNDLEDYLAKHQFIVIAEKDLGPRGGTRHYPVMLQIKDYLSKTDKIKLDKIKTIPLPDGDNIIIYELNPKQP